MKTLSRSLSAAVVVALVGLAPAAAAEGGHKPGAKGFGVNLPADTTMVTTAGKTVPHPCAGRKLAYHSHLDALYGTRDHGKLAVMAVDGQDVVPLDTLCFRLAPDANADGKEVSRFVVPDDEKYSFLGAPSDIVWVAPQAVDFTDSWRPIWAGLGAFDPAHELGAIPDNFADGKMHFDMLDFSGPGDMSVFWGNLNWGQEPELDFNSADATKHTISYEVGYHGHYNWAFTKPGIYKIEWQGRAELIDGTTQLTSPVTQYWLVGSDQQTGLPAGTTKNLRTITDPIQPAPGSALEPADEKGGQKGGQKGWQSLLPQEQIPREQIPQAEVPLEQEPQGQVPGRGAGPDPAKDRKCHVAAALGRKPEGFIGSGHLDIALKSLDEGRIGVRLMDDSDPRHRVERESGTFALEIPDYAAREIPSLVRNKLPGAPEKLWYLPQSQDPKLPWVGFSTTELADGVLSDRALITVQMTQVRGPGRLIAWHESLSAIKEDFDSENLGRTVKYPLRAHDHLNVGFDKPGYYTATFTFTGKTAGGEHIEEAIDVPFLVGDDTIADARDHKSDGYAGVGDPESLCTHLGSTGGAGSGADSGEWSVQDIKGIEAAIKGLDSALGSMLDKLGALIGSVRNRDSGDTEASSPRFSRPAGPPSGSQTQPAGADTATSGASVAGVNATGGSASTGPTDRSGGGAGASAAADGGDGGAQTQPAGSADLSAGKSAGNGQSEAEGTDVSSGDTEETSGPGEAEYFESPDGESPIRSSIDGTENAVAAEDPGLFGDASSINSLTAGGFWSGLALGIGIMALLGGLVLFNAARRMLNQVTVGVEGED